MIGTTLQDRYRLDAELGRGGMGVVYRAHDTLLDRIVAVKVLSETGLGTEGRARLLREAQAAARLNHPNVVMVHDAGQFNGSPFIVMELVEGQTLHEYSPQGLNEILDIACQVCAALEHAHTHGIVHRDLKPENILITRGPLPSGAPSQEEGQGLRVKLMDFGLAHSRHASRLTQQGTLVGTVFYLSPEQVLGEEIDGRADLYALGVMLYELATGRLPFTADDPVAVISGHLQGTVVPPRQYQPDLPPAFEAVILRLLAKRPADRYATAGDVLRGLADVWDERTSSETGAASQAVGITRSDRTGAGRFVGRERELAQLATEWRRALAGEGHIVLIGGEAGMGKTRLVREFVEAVSSSGAAVLFGECYAEAGLPFSPFADALRSLLGVPSERVGDDPVWRIQPGAGEADLLELVPEYRAFYPDLPSAPLLTPDAQRRRLFEAYTLLLDRLAVERPILLIVDDLHWVDDASLDLLLHLARRLSRRRVLVVATYRPHETTPELSKALTTLERARLIHEIQLVPLDAPAVAVFVRSLLDLSADPPSDFLDALYARTEGNPFFIEELLKMVGDSAQPTILSRATLEAVNLPRSIRETIRRQMDELSGSAQAVATRAAVIGRRFDFDFLCAVAGLEEGTLLDGLRALVQAQIIVENASETNVTYVFRHPLMHEVFYQGSLAIERRQWHALVGRELELSVGFDEAHLAYIRASLSHHWWAQDKSIAVPAEVDQLAHHFVSAGEWEHAFRFALLAAERNSAIFAERAALRWSNVALELVGDGRVSPPPLALIDAYTARCTCQWLLGDYRAAVEDGQTALHLARDQGDWQREASTLHWLSHIRLHEGLYEESIRLAEESLAIAEAHDDLAGVAHLLLNLGEAKISGVRGERGEGVAHLERARPLCEALGDRQGLAHIETGVGHMRLIWGEYQEAIGHLERAVALGRELRDALVLASALNYLGIALRDVGEYDDSLARLHEAWRAAESGDIQAQAGFALATLGSVYLLKGDYGQAMGMARRGVGVLEAISANSLLPYALDVLGDVHRELGEAGQALECYERALPIAREVQDPCWESFALAGRGLTRLPDEGIDAALDDLQAAFAVCHQRRDMYSRATTLALSRLAGGYLAANRVEEAARLATETLQLAETGNLRDLAAESHRLLGQVHARREQWPESEAELGHALEIARNLGSPSLEWRARQALATVYQAQGKSEAAEAEFAAAAAIVRDLSQRVGTDAAQDAFLARPEIQVVIEHGAGQ